MRGAVVLGLGCDSACVFCAQEGLERSARPDGAVLEQLGALHASGATAVTFTGGEPSLDPRLEGLVARARAAGFARVGVQTNGVALAGPGRLEELASAGLTDVHLSLHGAEARVHDWHTGRPGSFDAASRTLARARAVGLGVVVATVLTRPGFRVLGALPRWLASRGVSAWCIEVPRWRGRAAQAPDRVVPRLALAIPFALHALDAAKALGLPAFIRGAPSCLLGPMVARALPAEPRAYGEACAECPARGSCPGVEAEYLARHGQGELAPCAPAATGPTDLGTAEAFVGTGEVAGPSSAPIPPPPEQARVRLPMLGRPAPGAAEVPAGAPRQTGEALRAILPDLFAPGAPDEGPDEGDGPR